MCMFLSAELSPEESEDVLFKEVGHFTWFYIYLFSFVCQPLYFPNQRCNQYTCFS